MRYGAEHLSDHLISHIRILLQTIIAVIIGVVLFLFIQNRFGGKGVTKPHRPLPERRAVLTIKGFHHVATRNGKIEWSLDANQAKLYSDVAVLNNISGRFKESKDNDIIFQGDTGRVNLKTLDIQMKGDVRVIFGERLLCTSVLLYHHDSHMITIDAPVRVSGPKGTIQADSARLMTDTAEVILNGGVKGILKNGFGL